MSYLGRDSPAAAYNDECNMNSSPYCLLPPNTTFSTFVAIDPKIMNMISSIRAAIKALPHVDLSNPHKATELPFPSPHPIPIERFTPTPPSNDPPQRFYFMGRFHFQHILDEMQDPNYLNGLRDLYLYGTSGTGKYHLLAALVCHLVQKGERVVYIPDCSILLTDHTNHIRTALLFAFYDRPTLRDEIIRAKDMNALLRFTRRQPYRSLHVVVDQRNALELDLDSVADIHRDLKATIWNNLNELRVHHRYIFSASANARSDKYRNLKQSPIKTVYLRDGLRKVCPSLFNYLASYSPG